MNALQIGMPRKEVVLLMGTPAKIRQIGSREVLQFNLHKSLDEPYAPDEPYWVFIEDGHVVQHGRNEDFKTPPDPPQEEVTPDIRLS